MTTYEVLDRALNPSFQLSINPSNQIVAIPRRKSCCTKLDQVQREREAVEAATRWLSSHSPTDTNSYQAFRGIYRKVSQHQIAVHRLTHGFIGWLKSLFRGKAKTNELRKLEASLIEMQKTMRLGNHLSEAITSQIEASDRSITSDILFQQVAAEMPEAVVSPKTQVTIEDFGLTEDNLIPNKPFLLQRQGKSHYNVIFPPANHLNDLEIVSVDSLLDLPHLVRERNIQKFFRACYSINSRMEDLQGDLRTTVNNLHITLEPVNPDRNSYKLVAHFRNPLSGIIETRELILEQNHTEEFVVQWANRLIEENRTRLEEIDNRILVNNNYHIYADFINCQYTAMATIGEREQRFSHDGLDEQSFNKIKCQIVREINRNLFNRSCQRIYNNSANIVIINIGDYDFRIRDRLDPAARKAMSKDGGYTIKVTNRSTEEEKKIRDTHEGEDLKKVLEETIEKFCPYHFACNDLLFSDNTLYLFSLDQEQNRQVLNRKVALIPKPDPTNPTKLMVKYYLPSTGNLETEKRSVNSETTPEEVRAWIEGILYRANRS